MTRRPDRLTKSSIVRLRLLTTCGVKYPTLLSDVLRVVRKGPAIKNEVDDAIDLCAEVFNLRDSIEEARSQCEQATDDRQKKALANKGAYGGWRIAD